jgi:hypothetical protein
MKSKDRSAARRMLAIYDGQTCLGTVVWSESTHRALAWNASRRFIGRFNAVKAAARAIGGAGDLERKAAA